MHFSDIWWSFTHYRWRCIIWKSWNLPVISIDQYRLSVLFGSNETANLLLTKSLSLDSFATAKIDTRPMVSGRSMYRNFCLGWASIISNGLFNVVLISTVLFRLLVKLRGTKYLIGPEKQNKIVWDLIFISVSLAFTLASLAFCTTLHTYSTTNWNKGAAH